MNFKKRTEIETVYSNVCETILPASLQLNKCQSVNKKIDNLKALALHRNRRKYEARIVHGWAIINENKILAQRTSILMLFYSLLLSSFLSVADHRKYSLSRDTRVKPIVVDHTRMCARKRGYSCMRPAEHGKKNT